MKIPRVNFSFAPHIAFFYAVGFLSKHGGFGSASERRLKLLKKRFSLAKGGVRKFLELADDYQLFTQLKKALIYTNSPKHAVIQSRLWQEYLASYNHLIKKKIPKSLKIKGNSFVENLAHQWKLNRNTILRIAREYKFDFPAKVECFVVPNIGEYGEAFDNVIVLSLDFQDINVAFAVFLEEFVHLGITLSVRRRVEKVFPFLPQSLQEEVLVGFLINQILQKMGYDDSIREAIVYGWQVKKRAKLIRRLEIHFRRNRESVTK